MLELLERYTRAGEQSGWRVWTVFPTFAFSSVVFIAATSVSAPIVAYFTLDGEMFLRHSWTMGAIIALVLILSVTGYLIYARKSYRILLDAHRRRVIAKPIFFGSVRSAPFDEADVWIGSSSDRRLSTTQLETSASFESIFTSCVTAGQSLFLSINEFDKPVLLKRKVEPVHKYLLFELASLLGKRVHCEDG